MWVAEKKLNLSRMGSLASRRTPGSAKTDLPSDITPRQNSATKTVVFASKKSELIVDAQFAHYSRIPNANSLDDSLKKNVLPAKENMNP